jgi:pyridoxal phosphate-dependent aminotransferase EpsN
MSTQSFKSPFDIYLSPPDIGALERSYVQEAFDTNWIAPLGPQVDAFEREVAEYLDPTLHAAALSSGTAALHLGLILLGVSRGDRVICSSLTFIGSSNPIMYCGAEPVFVDSERSSWNMSPALLEQALKQCQTEGRPAKAVLPVCLYGQSADMDQIREICCKYGVSILEDAAESLGATYKEKKSGTFGEFSVLSFNGNKIITTSGGGMLLSRDAKAIAFAKKLATQARDPQPYYEHSMIGYNYRLSSVCAAIGRGQMRSLDAKIAKRRQIFRRYEQAFRNVEGLRMMPEAEFGQSTRWLTALTLDPRVIQKAPLKIVSEMAAQRIEARPVWKPLHLQPIYKSCSVFLDHDSVDDAGVCTELFHQGLCLPSGSNLSEQQQDRVIESFLAAIL